MSELSQAGEATTSGAAVVIAKLALAVERDVAHARAAANAHTLSMPTERAATLTTV